MNRRSATRKLVDTPVGRKLTVILAAAILTTEGTESEAAAAGGDGGSAAATDAGGGNAAAVGGEAGAATAAAAQAATPSADDVSALFTAEEIAAKKESVAAAKAEEERRAALTEEQRAAEDAAKAEESAKNSVPEEYADFKVAEGLTLDPEMVAAFKPLAKESGLTQEKAQKFVDLAVQIQQRTLDGIFAAHEERKSTWLKEAQADPEIGEDVKKWDPEVKDSAKDSVAVRAFNTIAQNHPQLRAAVDELGIGNHPEFLRMFYRIGKMMREDTFELGGGGETGATSIAKTLWPGLK